MKMLLDYCHYKYVKEMYVYHLYIKCSVGRVFVWSVDARLTGKDFTI